MKKKIIFKNNEFNLEFLNFWHMPRWISQSQTTNERLSEIIEIGFFFNWIANSSMKSLVVILELLFQAKIMVWALSLIFMKSQNKVCNDCCTFSGIIIRWIDRDKMQQKPKCKCKSLFASNSRAASNVCFRSFRPKTWNFEAFIIILKSLQLSENWTIQYGA